MIINNSDKTLILEWMGRSKELPSHWSLELDKESEDYLVLKYKGLISGGSSPNSIIEMIKSEDDSVKSPKVSRKKNEKNI